MHFSIPIHNSSSVFTGSIAGRRGRELVAQVCTALGSLRPRQTGKQAHLAAIVPSHTRRMWRRRCMTPDGRRPNCSLAASCFIFDRQSHAFHETTSRSMPASCGSRWGHIDGRSQPIKQKRAHPSAQFSTHNGFTWPNTVFLPPCTLFLCSQVTTLASELTWLPATKQSKS